jgi:aerobic carbon-monoxide dehydrogenase medium subunit
MAPESLEEALALRRQLGDDSNVVAGGTFLAVLRNQGFFLAASYLTLGRIASLRGIEVVGGELRLGAMVTHRRIELDPVVREGWPMLARAFSLVASRRVRNQATVGGVLADADYASDPPAAFTALGATVVLRSDTSERLVPVGDLIQDYYQTCIEHHELLVEVRVPAPDGAAAYRKFRSRSTEDRPCVSVAAARHGDGVRVVVGAVAGRPQEFPELCHGTPAEVGRAYAERISPIGDARGSSAYRRRVIAVEVRRALEAIA